MASKNPLVIVANAYEAEQIARDKQKMQVMWTRQELMVLMNLYGRAVATGQWRDYGLSILQDRAVFAIFRSTNEIPIYRIEKIPRLRPKHGQYQVLGLSGQILKRGNDLQQALKIIEKKTCHSGNIRLVRP